MSTRAEKFEILRQRADRNMRLPAFPVPDTWNPIIEQQVLSTFTGMTKLEYITTQFAMTGMDVSRAVREAHGVLITIEEFLLDLAEENAERCAEAEAAKEAP